MQAIRTKFIPATDKTGKRVSAECEGGRIVMPYWYNLDGQANHAAAALILIEKLGWEDRYAGACFKGDYYWSPVIEGTKWTTVVQRVKPIDRKIAAEVEALRSALGNIEQALGLGHLRTDGGAA